MEAECMGSQDLGCTRVGRNPCSWLRAEFGRGVSFARVIKREDTCALLDLASDHALLVLAFDVDGECMLTEETDCTLVGVGDDARDVL